MNFIIMGQKTSEIFLPRLGVLFVLFKYVTWLKFSKTATDLDALSCHSEDGVANTLDLRVDRRLSRQNNNHKLKSLKSKE